MSDDLDTILQTTTTQVVTVECGLCGRTVPVTTRFIWMRTEDTCRAAPIPTHDQAHHCREVQL